MYLYFSFFCSPKSLSSCITFCSFIPTQKYYIYVYLSFLSQTSFPLAICFFSLLASTRWGNTSEKEELQQHFSYVKSSRLWLGRCENLPAFSMRNMSFCWTFSLLLYPLPDCHTGPFYIAHGKKIRDRMKHAWFMALHLSICMNLPQPETSISKT